MRKYVLIVILIVLAVGVGAYLLSSRNINVPTSLPSHSPRVLDKTKAPYFETPIEATKVTSPLTVKGVVPAGWMFEGQLPIKLLDSKRDVIVATNALETTPGSWQSGEPAEFSTTLSWGASSLGGSTSGYLVISKDNSGGLLPKKEDSYEIPVKF